MMEALAQRLAAIGARRTDAARETVAEALRGEMPGDVVVTVEGEAVVMSGRRLGMRWLRGLRSSPVRGGGAQLGADGAFAASPLHRRSGGPPPRTGEELL